MRAFFVGLVVLLMASPAGAVELHYAPAENLERIDIAQILSARRSIDMAAYVLTDRPLMNALLDAAARGVTIRLYFDGQQSGERYMEPVGLLGQLYNAPGVQIRIKREGRPIMHLKSYCVDGRLFRTGSANFSASGLRDQDNDLILAEDPSLCARFTADFDAVWGGADAE